MDHFYNYHSQNDLRSYRKLLSNLRCLACPQLSESVSPVPGKMRAECAEKGHGHLQIANSKIGIDAL